MDTPINEDKESVESESDNYLSDNSSSSNFSFRRKALSIELSKLVDKIEPLDDSTSFNAKYYSGVEETILEEDDEQIEPQNQTNEKIS